MEKRLAFTIVGTSALLCNSPLSMQAGGAKTPSKGGKKIPTPVEEAESKVYLQDGKFCFPSLGIRNAIIAASSNWGSLSGKKRGTLKSSVTHIQLEPEFCPITADGKVIKTYELETRRVVVQGSGIMRTRPKFPQWELSFEIIYEDDLIAGEGVEKMFHDLINDAGRRIGIGDYRPSKSGWFGRFKVLE